MRLSSSCLAAAAIAATVGLINLAPAQAADPATVTVRVEGLAETKLTPTSVTTTNAPVVKDGNPEHACAGTSALGALELATGGSWGGTWFGGELGYSVETILGESHLFESGSPANYFWSFWLDDHEPQEVGPCAATLQSGDRVLFLPTCFGEACPKGSTAPSPLELEAPATANVGEAVPVIVKRYDAQGQAAPAAGATITGAAGAAVTDSGGRATVSFAGPGAQVLRASAPESVRTESPVCVHNGNDGTCGANAPGLPPSSGVAAVALSPYRGPFAVVARVGGVPENRVYSRRHAPRLIRGTATAHTAVTSLSMSLRRSYRGRCFALSDTVARFVRARCGRDAFFRVSSSASFSYLLPAPLRRGRYVLDLEATDAAGNRTTLARGTTRTVFYVR
jgi:hypothetical protein